MNCKYKELVDKAYSYHLSNNFEDAEKIYKSLLKLSPDDVNVLNLYGLLCIAKKKSEQAVDYLSRAFILKKSAYIGANLAKAYYMNHEPLKAIKIYKQALEYGENDDIYYSLALAYKQIGDIDNIILNYKKALELNPGNYNALYNMSLAYKDKNDIDNAISCANECLKLKRDDEDVYTMLSGYYEEKEDYKNAILNLEKAVCLNNKNYLYYYNLGVLYSKINNIKKAIENYNNSISLNKEYLEAYVNIASLYKTDNKELALEYLKTAYNINPDEDDVCLSLAQTYRALYENDKSINILNEVINRNKNSAEAYSLLAINYMDYGEYKTALNYYEQALKIMPENLNYLHGKAISLKYMGNIDETKQLLEYIVNKDNTSVQSSIALGMIYLTEKNFKKGMELYCLRSSKTKFADVFKDKVWKSDKSIENKSVLVYSDCGLGDTIMCARYLNLLKEKASNVILQTDKELLRILSRNYKNIQVTGKAKEPGEYNIVIPMMSLPYALNSDFNSIPYSKGYLTSNEELTAEFSQLDIFKTEKKKIGLVWEGNKRIFKNRFLNVKEFSKLLEKEHLKFYSFQLNESQETPKKITNLNKYISDYEDTAALLKNIDILITIDSSIVHMAGALGIKTFLLLPKTAEWRWFNDMDKSIWYDSVKIYRQTTSGNWSDVINRLEKELI